VLSSFRNWKRRVADAQATTEHAEADWLELAIGLTQAGNSPGTPPSRPDLNQTASAIPGAFIVTHLKRPISHAFLRSKSATIRQ